MKEILAALVALILSLNSSAPQNKLEIAPVPTPTKVMVSVTPTISPKPNQVSAINESSGKTIEKVTEKAIEKSPVLSPVIVSPTTVPTISITPYPTYIFLPPEPCPELPIDRAHNDKLQYIDPPICMDLYSL
jgi:hypothetical protein